MSRFRDLFNVASPVIGMIHLPPLPDYPESPGTKNIVVQALRDLSTLASCGVDGVLVENEYDRPHKLTASPETVAAMKEVSTAVVSEARDVVVGCEILLNDPQASLDVTKACGAAFIRTDYFVDRMLRPEYGEMHIDPVGLLHYREEIGATDILILADIQVKHATMLREHSLAHSARMACEYRADAIIVTGRETGDAPDVCQLREAAVGVRQYGADVPVLIGSGLTPDNAAELLPVCDGVIVGTALMSDRHVDAEKTAALMEQVRKERRCR